MICLIVTINKKQKVTILEPVIGKEVIIGRDDTCDISLQQADGLSRRHCCIRFAEKEVYISDLGSTNGVYADAVKLESETPMQEGVKYTLGDAEMQITGLKQYSPKANQSEPEPKEQPAAPPAPKEEKPADVHASKTNTPPVVVVKKSAKLVKEEMEELAASRRVQSMAKQLKRPSVSLLELLLVLLGAFIAGVFLNSAVTYGDPFTPFKKQAAIEPPVAPPAPEEELILTEEEEDTGAEEPPATEIAPEAPDEEADDAPAVESN